ncbi:MAG: RdgB/HAM1 family non-canonical purine NTP pyrophosphatase [Planctomycetota bacterium]|nr:RdgB/HAM1 family non-canonical purine NTP pyrophosphatase [Planctomycetota bacterium]
MNGRVLVIGSGNPDKLGEIEAILAGLPVSIRPAAAYGRFDPVEDSATLEGNAEIKAVAARDLSGQWAIADDTGLFVDALGGEPGVHAARYAGPDGNYEANRRKLLECMRGVPKGKRGARFVCVIAFARPGEPTLFFRGTVEGEITESLRGSGGFGYDPVFFASEIGMTLAEAPPALKNSISHRYRALAAFRAAFARLLGLGGGRGGGDRD